MIVDVFSLLGPNAVPKSAAMKMFVTKPKKIGPEHTEEIETLINSANDDNYVGRSLAKAAASDPKIAHQQKIMLPSSAVDVVSNLIEARKILLAEHNYDEDLERPRGKEAVSLSKRLGEIIGTFFAEMARIDPNQVINFIKEFVRSRAAGS